MLRFRERYRKEVVPALVAKFGYKNQMAAPRIEKVFVNTGFGRLVAGATGDEQKKICQSVLEDLALICGQKPVLTLSKKSIASFKLRKGMAIGAKVTLRGKRMEDFVDRLIRIALPRSRDFQGISPKSIDKEGNLTVGLKEQITFPEISPENTKRIFGLEAIIVTTAKNKEEGTELFRLLGFPIKFS
ncbi:MAG: 50S ribosomal protein L5 [Candidatus Wildermuthbacteria bacterium GWA2_46_15]|uniref:Large ribosomal subunit protein uL5 n=1 Tax=Candidatus Wildermuthbacteria bacterium GWA2_46_15 TaxID=1802443 RepID=A0A1G2QQR4_9BACT|nr:MAG: 50S ribosomal protein L5 [Candidatus Wildermuthbacteria bacterium GWA2_46_15]